VTSSGRQLGGAGRVALIIIALLVLIVVASQLLLPVYAEHRVDDRLTRNGGNADVSISAFPALRLLAKHGDRLAIDAKRVRIAPRASEARVFDDLDRFEEIDIELEDSSAGPIRISDASLERSSNERAYRLTLQGDASGSSLLDYTQADSAGSLSDIAGLARGITGVTRGVPIGLDVAVESDDGLPRVISGGGTIGGFPASLFVQMIGSAVSGRL
jgi:hypothetical protein